jgi:molybdopterin converting factor subunit 1
MKVNVKLFAVARQWAEADAVELDLPADAKVADLRQTLVNRLPRLESFGQHLRFAVNSEYADEETSIPAGADVACIPPVSGG